jgi:casein kinase 1
MCNKKFHLKTVAMIAIQMLERIQFLHLKGFIHRDVKPDNFVIGSDSKGYKIYLIDFGLAKRYLDKDGNHIPYKDNKNLTGTARYASLNTHLGIEQGRRDDLECIGNVLLYLLKGDLPWQNMRANNKKEKYEKIMDKKLSIPLQKLCLDIPSELQELLRYSRCLEFEETPDYEYLIGLFKKLMEREKLEMDYEYCWGSLKREEYCFSEEGKS